ncbi:MAG: carbohydrate ABC transporter permease [Oscillospiraceae bacterium]|nr:carbohydrate ABC transporter permease [Oscillospiraceae bacterium]
MVSALFFLYMLTLIFPFVWMLLNSLKTNMDFFKDIWSLPEKPLLSNYVNVWDQMNLLVYFGNSIKLTLLGTLASILTASMASYVIAKYKFKLSKLLYTMAIVVMLIPSIGTIAALYKFMISTHLFNTHLGLVLLYSGGFGFNFILLYGFFKSVSWSYAEAGFVDGASDAQVFLRIMLPQARPGIIAVAIIQGINVWNDYFNPYMFLQDKSKMTLAVGIYNLVQEQSYAADWPKLFAAMIIATVPVLIVYAIFSNTIIENTVAGGLKG